MRTPTGWWRSGREHGTQCARLPDRRPTAHLAFIANTHSIRLRTDDTIEMHSFAATKERRPPATQRCIYIAVRSQAGKQDHHRCGRKEWI